MRYLALFLFAAVMWLLVSFATAARVAVTARREGEEPYGVSILAYVVVPPAAFTGLAYLIDRARPDMGLWVVAGVHAFIGVAAIAFTLRGRAVLRKMD